MNVLPSVHLSPQEEECTSGGRMHLFFVRGQQNVHIWQHSKFTEETNWKKWEWHYIAKIRISVEKDNFKHLKAFGIISSEIPILLLILSWYFSCLHIQIFFLLSCELKMFLQIFVSKAYRSVILKNNSLWKVDMIFINNFLEDMF